jgi:pilus assembly protein TadC
MTITPILLILFAGGILLAAVYRITPRQAWSSLRGRVEALEELQRRQARRRELVRTLPDFLGNLLVGYGVKGQVLEAFEFTARLGGGDALSQAVAGALRQGRLSEDKYPPLYAMAADLGDPLLADLLRLLQQAEEEGGDIAAILESYLAHAYQRKATQLLEQAKVLPLQLLGITVPLLLPTLIIVMVAPFLFAALEAVGM